MYPKPIQNFISKLSKLPSIGPRQAARLAFWLLKQPKDFLEDLRKSFEELARTETCPICFFTIENQQKNSQSRCQFCQNTARDHSSLCIVEKETDLISIEKAGVYKGLYHILGGLFSGLDNKIPAHLRIPEILTRIENAQKTGSSIKEVIIALSPTHEGDLTSHHLENLLRPLKIKITRLARGLPYGSEIEFADFETLSGAMKSRQERK